MSTDRSEFIQGLRDAAIFLEEHPDVPCPYWASLDVFLNTRDDFSAVARLATWEKVPVGAFFSLRKTFGPHLKLDINVGRDEICRRVVTGTRVVPAQPESVVEEYEWVCDAPILEAK